MNSKSCMLSIIIVVILIFSGCANGKTAEYHKISQAEAKAIMDSGDDYILLDVRTQNEYDNERIAGAILIPVDEIKERAADELPDAGALIMVYCRSGMRSKTASEILVESGYTNIHDIGGISTWPYGTE